MADGYTNGVTDPIEKMSLQDLTTEFQAVSKQVREMHKALPEKLSRGEALLRELDRRCSFELFGFAPLAAPGIAAQTEEPTAECASMQPHPSFIDTNFEEPARPFTELPVELPGAPQPASAGLGAGGEQDSAPEAPPAAPHDAGDGYANGIDP